MKKAMALLALLLMPAVFAQDYASGQVGSLTADLYIVAANYDPSPIVPGNYVDIWLRVENRGDTEAPDVVVSVSEEFPWRAIDGRTVDLGRLGPNSAAIASFRLLVDGAAPGGPTPLRVRLQRSALDTPEVAQLSVDVERLDAVLAIQSVVAERVAPGETFNVDVTVANSASSVLRAIKGTLRLLTQVTTTGGLSTVELPFTPIGGGIERTVDALAPGESRTMRFTLVVDPDAESKPYKLPLEISYFDPSGTNRTRQEVVGVIVGADPELSVAIDSTALSSDTTTGDVIVRFVNYGVGDIKFLTARMQATDEFVIVSSPDVYVGKIDSDDYETAEFRLALTSAADDQVEIPLVMEYRDANNDKYSKGVSLTVVRYTPKQLGTQQSNTLLVFFVVIVLGVVGWFAYRRFRKKRAK
ncbi:hypothetical protein HY493_03710 [Candidatus Woesearchaeota archaeon]|nr:hypothetical protein [Candidatus Woesearchaeota archaeon]